MAATVPQHHHGSPCARVGTVPPYSLCTCARNCQCMCHGPQEGLKARGIPETRDFNTTYGRSHVQHPQSRGKDLPITAKGTHFGRPDLSGPFRTEHQAEYTRKGAGPADSFRPIKQFRPLNGLNYDSTYGRNFRPHTPGAAERAFHREKPLKRLPGDFRTTHGEQYQHPTPDYYRRPAVLPVTRARAPSTGPLDTEYRRKFLDHGVPPAEMMRPIVHPPPGAIGKYTTSTGDGHPWPGDEFYQKQRAFTPHRGKSFPLNRKTSTKTEDYPDWSDQVDRSMRPPAHQHCNLCVGPHDLSTTTGRNFGPKACYCCPCAITS